MNISFNNISVPQNTENPSYQARPKKLEQNLVNEVCNDILEFSSKADVHLPEKFEFTPIEATAKELMLQIRKIIQNLIVQKMNLRRYYSAADKYDYQELLKEKRRVQSRLDRLSKKAGYENYGLEHIVHEKREYNFYAPKIYRANSIEELDALAVMIREKPLYKSVKSLLQQLVELRKKEIQKY